MEKRLTGNNFARLFFCIAAAMLLFVTLSVNVLAAPSPAINKNNFEKRNYISTDGKTYTNHSDGKPKVLSFINGSGGCFLSNSYVSNLQSLNLKDVDVMVIDVFAAKIDPVVRYKDAYGPNNKDVIFACSATAQASWDIFEYSLNILGNYNPSFPVVFYIDKNNKIVAATHKDYSKETFADNCKTYFGVDVISKDGGSKEPAAKSVSIKNLTYTGSKLKPVVVAKDSNGKTIKSSDYTVTYSPSTVKGVGKYTATVKFKGSYKGAALKTTFNVLPKAVSKVNTPVAGKGQFKLSFTPAKGFKKYQIVYSDKSSFPSASTKKVSVTLSKDTGTATKAVSGLSSNKTYYVKLRTVQSVNGKNYYSAWSATKKVKTR